MRRRARKADLIEEVDLGYLIARVIRTYHMGYREVMNLPMPVFWELSGQVDRIRADEARINLQVGVALNSQEATQSFNKWLDKVAPGPFKMSIEATAEPDPGAFDELRSLASM